MPPREMGGRGRGRGPGRGRGRGGGRGDIPVPQGQEIYHSAVAGAQPDVQEAILRGEEVQLRAPENLQPAALDAGAILQQLATVMVTIARGIRAGPHFQTQEGSTKTFYKSKRDKSAGAQQERTGRKRFKGSSSAPQTYQESTTPKQSKNLGGKLSKLIVCFNCGQPGHKIRECPNGKKKDELRRQEGGSQRPIVCYNCKQPGHKSIKCPQGKRQGEQIGCYGCGQRGHIQRFCPYAQEDIGRREMPPRQLIQSDRPGTSQTVQQQIQQRDASQGSMQAGTSAVAQQEGPTEPKLTRGIFVSTH